ncbi:alpha/beta hydrolase [Undibacterium baiyunense]|uniref:Alpha/beta hydrolase n=1 Tax=Undibacterium baiyunense TaxID=2828731 RepID=A0A941DFA5_9BURK|nr:alpha/beta hydrolase [Undibacterium baiyunense]MBR7745212.1 alpha/beta hydrolase [Undibacterium baiyunense]
MVTTIIQGRISHRIRSIYHLYEVSAKVLWRRLIGNPLEKEWPIMFEIGTLFWRRQFNYAMSLPDIRETRAFLDSVFTVLDNTDDVRIAPSEHGEPPGDWFEPSNARTDVTMLYLHGGGYTFYMDVTRHYIALLAKTLGIRIFAPDYRLTPEHPHPAQMDDAAAAYRYLLADGCEPQSIIVAGESAGGHLVLMLLWQLIEQGLPQPALGMPISAWPDTTDRGKSLFENDYYDMVQGYMTQDFSRWLKGNTNYSDAMVSPITKDYRQSAPIYMQAGGKEILVDMNRDFANYAAQQGARIRLDVWPHMTHEFHAYGQHHPDSKAALQQMALAIDWALAGASAGGFLALDLTETDSL